jgi:hypothetical protein
MKPEQIKKVLSDIKTCPSKWELDNIIWADRTTNPTVLTKFLYRIEWLMSLPDTLTPNEKLELEILTELLADIDETECANLLNQSEEESKDTFIENLARSSAIEVLTNGKMSFESMTTACKLSPNDFILCAKRTQDIINAIHGLVIKGETLSNDVAGA